MEKIFAVTGTYHGSIVYAKTEGEARMAFHKKYNGESIICDDFIPCEIPGCCNRAVDVNHIESRGMGGDPQKKKDKIENLMGMCREHHYLYGDDPSKDEWLKQVHLDFMYKPKSI